MPSACHAERRAIAVRGDVVVDALGRYRCPAGWPRAAGEPTDSGAIYYCRYFELAEGVEHLDAPILNPRGDLGYMGFNTFRGDNRTFAVILLVPAADHELRVLRHDQAWRAACSAITPLDVMTSADYARPITGVMPMGGPDERGPNRRPPCAGIIAVGDAFCHTDPAFAYGLSFALAHAQALADAAAEAPDVDSIVSATGPMPARSARAARARLRHRRARPCAGRASRWRSADATGATRSSRSWAPWPPRLTTTSVLRRTIRRIGLLDRTAVFDEDDALHDRIEAILEELATRPPSPIGPPREELLARLAALTPGGGAPVPERAAATSA